MVEIPARIKQIISRYREELAKSGVKAEKLYLFGSYAKGIFDEYSDIDLIVISPDLTGLNMRERLELLGITAGRIYEPVEAVGLTPDEVTEKTFDFFYAKILEKEAVLV